MRRCPRYEQVRALGNPTAGSISTREYETFGVTRVVIDWEHYNHAMACKVKVSIKANQVHGYKFGNVIEVNTLAVIGEIVCNIWSLTYANYMRRHRRRYHHKCEKR